MFNFLSSKKRMEKRERIRAEREQAAAVEKQIADKIAEAENWFFSLGNMKRSEVLASLPSLPRRILSSEPKSIALCFYSVLSVLLTLSGACLLAGGYWGAPGLLFLVSSWMLFRGAEKRMGYGFSYIDPLTSALVTEVYSRYMEPEPGATSSPNTAVPAVTEGSCASEATGDSGELSPPV